MWKWPKLNFLNQLLSSMLALNGGHEITDLNYFIYSLGMKFTVAINSVTFSIFSVLF